MSLAPYRIFFATDEESGATDEPDEQDQSEERMKQLFSNGMNLALAEQDVKMQIEEAPRHLPRLSRRWLD